jgi:4-amino-4-deoxy-L-arabinose transferase-like glycosyltransferase
VATDTKTDRYKLAAALLLAAIVALGFAVRVARLDRVPPGFYIDEASFGYNAYSILKTGRDEFGAFLPLYTPSFGTGKNPVYLYATVASVALFGLNETAVRLPAALFGGLTVLLAYLLGAALTKRRAAGLLAALFLALCPWHIFFSRFAIEPTSMVFFTTLGIYLLVRGLEKPQLLPWSALALGISLYTYAPALPFVPLILAASFLCFRGRLASNRKHAFVAAAVLLLLALPHVIPGFKPDEQAGHFRASSIFTPIADKQSRALLAKSPWPGTLFANAPVPALRAAIIARNYLSGYSPAYLFFKGDMSTWRARVKGYGAFLPVFIPLLIAGLLFIIFSRSPEHKFLLCWFLLYPMGAAITTQTFPQATRTINALPCYEIIFAVAALGIYDWLKKRIASRAALNAFFAALTALYFISAGGFIGHYFIEYPKYSAYEWNSGFREAFAETERIKNNYAVVAVTKSVPYSYIYPLFYTKYDPASLQKAPLTREGPYLTGTIGKYVVRDTNLQLVGKPQLFITGIWERPDLRQLPSSLPDGVPPLVKIGVFIPDKRKPYR